MKKKFRNYLFTKIKRKIDKRKTGCILTFLAFIYHKLIWIRNYLYQSKFLHIRKAPIPVVSIGNIACGGTGKTPLTLLFAQELIAKGIKTGVASRGYRSKSEHKAIIACMGNGPLYQSEIIGDEPYLLAKRSPEILLGVGKNRLDSCKNLFSKGAEIVLLDDGMQHRKLFRDLEIVLLHASNLDFTKEYYLPKGLLRDEPKRLKEADLIIVNHANKNDFTRILASITVYSQAPVCIIGPSKEGIYSLDDSQTFSIENTPIGVFCAIADPKQFFKQLEEKNAKIVSKLVLSDHERILDKDLQKFAESCKRAGAKVLICTEKDAVKIKTHDMCLPIGYEKIRMQVFHGHENWEKFISKVISLIHK